MNIQRRPAMKNTLVYHLIVTLPIIAFFYYWLENGKSALALVTFGMLYAFIIFRPLMDYYRLRSLNIIEKDDMWKMWKWLGLYRFRYYNELMLGKR